MSSSLGGARPEAAYAAAYAEGRSSVTGTSDLGGGGPDDSRASSAGATSEDLSYAKSVERSLNRAVSARTKQRIEDKDARLAQRLAEHGSRALLRGDADDDEDDEGSSALDASGSAADDANRPITARTKQQLDDDEMLYDLHGSSGKGVSGAVGGHASPPALQGSSGSLLREGTATDNLSVTGRSAARGNGVGSTSLSGNLAGSQPVGLGNEYAGSGYVRPSLTTLGGPAGEMGRTSPTGMGGDPDGNSPSPSLPGRQSKGGLQRSTNAADLLGENTESESVWDTDKDQMTDHGSPSPEPPVSPSDLEALFSYIGQFKPEPIELEPVLKPFLPDYIPAIGDLEAMIKIPPPGSTAAASTTTAGKTQSPAVAAAAESNLSFYHDLGITVLDEPAAKQSDPAVLHYQLKALAKTSVLASEVEAPGLVHAILAHDPAKKLDDWIASTDAPDWTASRAGAAAYAPVRGRFPPIDRLMAAWDDEFASGSSGANDLIHAATQVVDPATGAGLLGALDLPLADAVRLACAILQIPVYAGGGKDGGSKGAAGAAAGNSSNPRALIDALHCFFELYAGFSESQHFNNSGNSMNGLDGIGSGSGSGIDMTGLDTVVYRSDSMDE
ncbi:hypothetical protein H9P43_002835 [Blastocladiella emersonii ATCC 22665]|nr:hypothetical protein H9P43_002835 [Blastocladiella emersonii ATCC 22665]